MGKAVSYALAQWESLEVYLKEPEIEIDNNLVENAIRPTALGKKNWLFFGDADAGQRSAIIYSIIESCRRHDIEPLASGHRPPPWPDVPAQVETWVSHANTTLGSDVPPIVHLAKLHGRLEQIHPFLDGNGRTGRLVLNLMLIRSGYPPAIVSKGQRAKYVAALRRFDRHDDALPLAELLARAVKHSIDRFVLPSLAGPLKLVPLGALVTRRLSSLALRRAAQRGRLRALRRRDQWVSTKQWVEEYVASRRRGRWPAPAST